LPGSHVESVLSEYRFKTQNYSLTGTGSVAFPGAMALSGDLAAVARLGQLAVGTDACLGVHAPKQTVIAGRHGMVALGIDEKSLPTKRGAQMRMAGIKP
jgi:hypothetical protein